VNRRDGISEFLQEATERTENPILKEPLITNVELGKAGRKSVLALFSSVPEFHINPDGSLQKIPNLRFLCYLL